ncbi:MAG: histidine kinase N-terminal 7TM domain-containing protein [Veillonellales bacterium]
MKIVMGISPIILMEERLLLMNESSLQIMIYYPIKEIWVYLLAAAALAAIAGYAWQYRRMMAARYWIFGLSLRAVFLLSLVMVTVSLAPEDKIFWVRIQQLSALAFIPIFLLFVVNLAGENTRATKIAVGILVAASAFGMLALLTTGWHGGYWRGVVWDGTTFGIIRGPIYWGITIIGYLQFLLVCLLCIVLAFRFKGLRRWQFAALPSNPLIAVTGHILWVIDQDRVIPPLPLAFLLSGIIWSWIFVRLRVLNLAQLAQTAVTHNMNDSLIILDDQDYIVEVNPAAEQLLGGQKTGLTGSWAATALAPWPALAELAGGREVRTGGISLAGGFYLYRVTPLTGWRNHEMGKAIVLEDITELKKAQARIAEQQKALVIATERDRLRRELHDGSGQIWSYLKLQYEQLRNLLAGRRLDEADSRLQKLVALSGDFHRSVRESLAGLKSGSGKGLVPALHEFIEWYERTYGIHTDLLISPEIAAQFSPSVELQLLRIIQEAMANIRKHACASQATVSFYIAEGQAVVVIEDDGSGFDPAVLAAKDNRHGLSIMQERAGEIGGGLRIDSAPGAGTRVTVRLPLGKGGQSHEITVG